MVLRRTSRLRITTLVLLGLFPFVEAQQRSPYDPAAGQRRSEKSQPGIVDFTLGRFNAQNQDYGKCLDEGRKMMLEESIENGYFWSNVVALGLLGCLFAVIVYQHRLQTRRDWTLAEMLAQYEQALLRANTQADQAAKKNGELAEALRALGEAAVRLPAAPVDLLDRTLLTPPRPRATKAQSAPAEAPKSSLAEPATDRAVTAVSAPAGPGQIGLFKPEVDLVMKVNSLEQQLGHSQEEAKQLRRQLNATDRQVQAEQQKNRALKGA